MITSNISEVLGTLAMRIEEAIKPENFTRVVATGIISTVHNRIHIQGKAADGSQIGTYSKGYMVVRTGAYKNAVRFSKGKSKGEVKNAGKFTKGLDIKVFGSIVLDTEKAGGARPNYNRTNDTKVILSLTRQMENDFSAVVNDKGEWGLGFKNPDNTDKAKWAEETYNKKIYDLTEEEKEKVLEIGIGYLQNMINATA